MRPNFLSGLGLLAGALLWPSPTLAQGFCYMVNAEGEVVNLDALCESDSSPPPAAPPAADPEVGEALVETQESETPRVRSYTIIGPVVGPESDEAEATTDSPAAAEDPETSGEPEANPAPPELSAPGSAVEADPATPDDSVDERNRSGLPGGEASTTEVRVLQTPDGTVTVID
ncbi:hypothetical protein IQ254_17120 [Nodosilinea sp. LEGE 07088]|uniref:hypothetical protein n=1 Tax=Nodosilinea sp. LEGE 07088 TaxID=2777968 RepID=UPI0018818695|nr:hypothetical protein [Nodosilinea sp. LEGE 07088]MBE9138892.1 hypothetical protein [Nodosilinea sp. LEGE 07088]